MNYFVVVQRGNKIITLNEVPKNKDPEEIFNNELDAAIATVNRKPFCNYTLQCCQSKDGKSKSVIKCEVYWDAESNRVKAVRSENSS